MRNWHFEPVGKLMKPNCRLGLGFFWIYCQRTDNDYENENM